MIRIFLLIFTLSFLSQSYSQDFKIEGTLTDTDGRPVAGARIYFVKSPNKKVNSNREGEYSIKCKAGEYDTLKIETYGLATYTVFIGAKKEKKARKSGVFKLDIIIPDKEFNPIVVRPTVPDTMFGTQEYSVEDFAFDQYGNLILLTYEKNLKSGAVLRLLDSEQEVIDVYYLDAKDPAIQLKNDFRGNVHLLTEGNVHFVLVQSGKLGVYQENRSYYFKYVDPIIDTIGNNIYFSNYSELYPAFDYFEFNLVDSLFKTLLTVEDDETMEFYRAEFKYLDNRTKMNLHNRELETGIDKEIWAGAMFYTNTIYYEPLYAPLFKIDDDSLLIFDHYKNLMFKYSSTGGFVDSVRINYHKQTKKSGWEQPLIQDKVTGSVYAIFLRNGYTFLSEIDSNTGQVKQSFKLYFKYVENIQVIDGQVYYIYRPFESTQKKYIYREDLNPT